MGSLDVIKQIYAASDRLVAVADKDMKILWKNRDDELSGFTSDNLLLFGEEKYQLPLKESVVAEYKSTHGRSYAVDITVIDNSDDAKYLLQFYSCSDIELFSDRSEHLKYKANFLGNIRNELSQIICLLDTNKPRFIQTGDIDYLRFDSKTRYHILRTLSSTVNLNEISKYFNGLYSTEAMCVSELLTEICADVEEMFDKSGCAFSYDIQPMAYAVTNRDRFTAAVCNLLINALMYNKAKEKKCSLTLGIQDEKIIISITDNGGSVSQQELEEFRQPFGAFRDFSTNESLGIAIASLYCDSLNGELRIECKKDVSTRLQMILPEAGSQTVNKFKVSRNARVPNPYDLRNCILAKGLDPLK